MSESCLKRAAGVGSSKMQGNKNESEKLDNGGGEEDIILLFLVSIMEESYLKEPV